MKAADENQTTGTSEVPSAPGQKSREKLIEEFRREARGEENLLVANLIHLTADQFEVAAELMELFRGAVQASKDSPGEAAQVRGEIFDDLMRTTKQTRGAAELIHRIKRRDHADGPGGRSPASRRTENESLPTTSAPEEVESGSVNPKRAR